MLDANHELEVLIRARSPVVAIHGADEQRVEGMLRALARQMGMPLYVWSVTQGMRLSGSLTEVNRGTGLDVAFSSALRTSRESLFFFKDLQTWWGEPETQRRLLDLARHFAMDCRTLVVAGPDIEVPLKLQHLCASWHLPLPGIEELRALAERVVKDFSGPVPVRVDLDAAGFDALVSSLHGMTLHEAERALCRAVADDLALTADDLDDVLEVKRGVLRESGVLEYVVPDLDLDQVGGLENLKHWLTLRRKAYGNQAKEFGLEPPKGVILLGVQGCGKSLAAKALAAAWGFPLLRLEAGRMYDKFIGESDKHLERALRAAEHMAPCVLWIDEIEKAFAHATSSDSDGGLSRRLLGRLLGWLQDRAAPVFVVATCNDIKQLPPELMRKGRFDEIFFVDLPTPAEREAVFKVHLARRGRSPDRFDLPALVDASVGFSGAEIEQAVVAALYRAFDGGRALDTALVQQELEETRPLSVTRHEEIAALRAWAEGRTVPAGRST